MDKNSIIISGSITIDRIMNFSNHYKDLIKPEKIHVLSLSIFLEKLKNTQGGVGANISYSLALLKEKPILIGSVGPDAKDYIQKLKKKKLNLKLISTLFPMITESFFLPKVD